jgi:hypothetical protein
LERGIVDGWIELKDGLVDTSKGTGTRVFHMQKQGGINYGNPVYERGKKGAEEAVGRAPHSRWRRPLMGVEKAGDDDRMAPWQCIGAGCDKFDF